MVEVTLLFWQFSLPRALLIILVLLIGILIGALVSRNKRYLFR
ncbi:lipopolysaccharide assembly protein LapA domain-containing protein [Marisediminitalea aggregata]|nr:lipopolysaccharide assembly protein LapA domain-containing protein [Marisediminitalea aggregata]